MCDWMDWMLPEAWNCEHNQQHHYKLGEDQDPDLVEENLGWMRDSEMPLFFKYAITAVLASIWKWFYYAPNTYKELKMHELRRTGQKPPAGVACEARTDPSTGDIYYVSDAVTLKEVIRGSLGLSTPWYSLTEFVTRVVGPYFLLHFVMIPGIVGYFLGDTAFWNCVINLGIAELLTNLHSFLIIVTNHAGGDMYRFRHPCQPKSAQFYMRAVTSGVDFATGNDLVDFFQGWLNYQIEHHMFPNLSMLSYQRMQPAIKALCKKYDVPYVQESVFVRLQKTVGVMVGTETMRRYPEEYEHFGAKVTVGQIESTE
jgi:fatty acid desaturase